MKKTNNSKSNINKKPRLSQMQCFQLEEETENYEIWNNRGSGMLMLLQLLNPSL